MKENQSNGTTTISLAALQDTRNSNAITLVEALGLLWKKRLLLLVFIVVGAVVGVFMGNWIRPMYSSDALLKLDVKGNKAGKAMGEMGMLLDMASPADAEIEMIKSRMVLSYVVDEEGLCFSAIPVGFMDRIRHREGRMDVANLVLPLERRGGWTARIVNDTLYEMISPDGDVVLQGTVGIEASALFEGDTVSMMVDKLKGKPGQKFKLGVTTPLNAARRLAAQLRVSERGKQTGVIGVSYSHRYPDRAQSILNSVANVYLRQNIEMRSAEAEKTLQFLENQLPGVKAKLDSSEKKLADYRHRIGSVDMSGETQAMLKKEQDLNMQILNLEQKRQEATRLFKAEHPTVQTITKQLAKLRGELSKLKSSAKKMPLTQQEVLTLQEEVSLNNAQYTSMLNNIQQLRVIRAGEVGTVRVVDYAVEDTEQTKPKKSRILICSVAAFFMMGVLLVFLIRLLKNGVRNALEIERETGISVYAKIPESRNKELRRAYRNGPMYRKGTLPLVCHSPEDPASEALRSLFTSVEFSATAEHPVIMVAGLVAGVGKSFVSRNLAALFAISGKKVLLVDADMRRGVVYSKHKQGLAEILAGKASLDEAVSLTDVENMSVIGAGSAKMAPTDLLHGERFPELLKLAKEKFDVIILDTPPINLVADTELILPQVDLSLYVLHYGRHTADQINEAMGKVDRLSEAPKAFVINHCEREGVHGYYGGYGYYSYRKKS
ncbi:MAG: polysaccharide biosynthesis tyrosine autokinase [Fibrobacter sp.]|nr:polysaccharide biosynthesis tyrosine autokinase [Fibrobacter sp.]